MNTIVFVLLTSVHSGWVPTLEFTSLDKCERAAAVIKDRLEQDMALGRTTRPKCVRIEK